MLGSVGRLGKERALAMFGDWTNRIARASYRRRHPGLRVPSETSSSRNGTGPVRSRICTMRSRLINEIRP